MKLHTRLLLTLGSAAVLAFALNFAVSDFGLRRSLEDYHEAAESVNHEFMTAFAAKSADSAAMIIGSKLDAVFSEMSRIYSSANPAAGTRAFFEQEKPDFIDGAFFAEEKEYSHIPNGNMENHPAMNPQGADVFASAIRRTVADKTYAIFAFPQEPGTFWQVCSGKKDNRFIAFRIHAAELLKACSAPKTISASLLSWKNGEIAAYSSGAIPSAIQNQLPNEAAKKRISVQTQVSEITTNEGECWAMASAGIQTRAENPTGLCLVKAITVPESIQKNMDSIGSELTVSEFILIIGMILGLLVFAPVLIIAARGLSDKISKAADYSRNIFRTDMNPEDLHIDYSEELTDLSDGMNFLRDKLNGALIRLSRSRERELQARKDAEKSNFLRPGILGELVAEIRKPLAGVRGFNQVVRKKSASDPDLAAAADQIEQNVKSLGGILHTLHDLSELDSVHEDISPMETDPVEIIRNTAGALTKISGEKNISIETNCNVRQEHPFLTSPALLKHVLTTAAEVLMRYAKHGTTLRISCENVEESLVFRCSDTHSEGTFSIAAVFKEYLRTGHLAVSGCASAILDLLVLKSESSLLNAETTFESPSGNSEISIVFAGRDMPNPAMTVRFTKARPDVVRTATALHYADAYAENTVRKNAKIHKPAGAPMMVLLVHVSEQDATLLQMLLNPAEFLLYRAGDDPLEDLREKPYDIVFADMSGLPAGNFTLVSSIHSLISHSGVLFALTDHLTSSFAEMAVDAGADEAMEKPVIAEDFLKKLQTYRA